MQQTEQIACLRQPNAQERAAVCRCLTPELKRQLLPSSGRTSGILCAALSLLLLVSTVYGTMHWKGVLLLFVLALLCGLCCFSMRRRQAAVRRQLDGLADGHYRIAEGMAFNIRATLDGDLSGAYGMANVVLSDGTKLKQRYALSRSAAMKRIRNKDADRLPVYLVKLADNKIRLVPREVLPPGERNAGQPRRLLL